METKTCKRGHVYELGKKCTPCIMLTRRARKDAALGIPDDVQNLRERSLASRLALKDHPYAVKLPDSYRQRNATYLKV